MLRCVYTHTHIHTDTHRQTHTHALAFRYMNTDPHPHTPTRISPPTPHYRSHVRSFGLAGRGRQFRAGYLPRVGLTKDSKQKKTRKKKYWPYRVGTRLGYLDALGLRNVSVGTILGAKSVKMPPAPPWRPPRSSSLYLLGARPVSTCRREGRGGGGWSGGGRGARGGGGGGIWRGGKGE